MDIENLSQPEGINEELGDEILEMAQEEQELRFAAAEVTTEEEKLANGEAIFKKDAENTARLKEIIEEYGWPTISKVGEKASKSAWLLVQHADQQPEFQKEVLSLLEEEMQAGEVSRRNVAYLTDRVRVNFGEPQLFGTQWWPGESGSGEPRPIEDPEHLDERREDYDLEPYTEYEAGMREIWDKEVQKWGTDQK